MKRFTTSISCMLVVMLCLTMSCEEDRRLLGEENYAVRFTNTGITLKESYAETVRIEVHNAGPAVNEDLVIRYRVSGSAREGTDYTIVGEERTVTIPAGEYFGYIEVELINNANNILRSQDIVFNLRTVDSDDVKVGQGSAGIGSTFTLSIQDDCILGGTYSGMRGTFSIPTEGITITSTDCLHYTLSNWNLSIDGPPFYEYPLTFVDNNDNTLTVDSFELDPYEVDGEGVIDPVTRKIKIELTITDPGTGENETYNLTYTPNQ